MAGTKTTTARPRAKSRATVQHRTDAAKITPLMTELNEAQLAEVMQCCEQLGIRLGHFTLRILLEQKQRAHERRMAALKQLGSAVAYAPVAVLDATRSAAKWVTGGVMQLLFARKARSQETTSS